MCPDRRPHRMPKEGRPLMFRGLWFRRRGESQKRQGPHFSVRSLERFRLGQDWYFFGALGGTRTPNLLIRSQMLYPLGDQRVPVKMLAGGAAEQKAD